MQKQKIVHYLLIASLILFLYSQYQVWQVTGKQADRDRICSLEDVYCPGERQPITLKTAFVQGVASWYDYTLADGWSSVGHYVCASRDFARKTRLRVTDLSTGKQVDCTVTDYIEHPGRVIDLSSTAFAALKPLKYGLIKQVRVEAIGR